MSAAKPPIEINHQQALAIISQLLNPSPDINVFALKKILNNYLIQQPEIGFLLPKTLTAEFLTALQAKIEDLIFEQKLKQTTISPEILEQWEKQYLEAQKKTESDSAKLPDWPIFRQQLKLALKFQAQTEQAVRFKLEKELNFLNPEEKEEIIQAVSQHLERDIIVAVQTAVLETENKTTKTLITQIKQTISSEFIADSIESLQKNNSHVALAITNKTKEKIAQSLAHPFLPDPQVLAWSYQKMTQIKISAAPNPKEIRAALEKYGIPNHEAEKTVFYLQTIYPPQHILPTQIETKNAFEQSLEKSLSLKTRRRLAKQGFDLTEIVTNLNEPVNNFYHLQAAILIQPKIGWQTAISKQAFRWAKKLNKIGVKTTPAAIENILRGVSVKKIEAEIARLKKQGLNPVVLFKLKKEVELLEKAFQQKKLPFFLRLKIKNAWLKVYFLTILEKINPLSLKFYQNYFPQIYQPTNIKLKLIKNQWNFLTQETPWGYFLTPFARLKKLHYRFNSWRWRSWNKITTKLIKNKKLQKALYLLPIKIKPSYWLHPIYWFRRATGKSLFLLGKKLGKKGLLKIGALIHRYALKNLIKRQVVRFLIKKGLGSLVALAVSGPVGAVVGTALFVWEGIKALINKNKREFFKQLVKKVLDAGSKIAIITAKLIASAPFTFLGATVGFVLAGPAGAVIGGIIGAIIDKGLAFFGGIGNALGSLGTAVSGFLPQLAGGAGIVSSLGTISLIGTVSALGATAIGTYFIIQNAASAFVVQPEYLTETVPLKKSAYFSVEKQVKPSSFSNLPATATYTIKITAAKKDINITAINDQVIIFPFKKIISSPFKPALPIKIPAGQTKTFSSYQINFSPEYNNSIAINQITVSANIIDGPFKEESLEEATVILGKPPTACFIFKNGKKEWILKDKEIEIKAIAYLSQWPNFISLVCQKGPVFLIREGRCLTRAGQEYGGMVIAKNKILVCDKAVQENKWNAIYTLAHESGHIIDIRNNLRPVYRNVVNIESEGYLPTYSLKKSESEDFAETIGLYSIWDKLIFPLKRGGKINYPQDFPTHYQFANCSIYSNNCSN